MTLDAIQNWSRAQLIAIISFALFGVAMLPPVLWVVNEPILIGGYPLLYLWAIGWGIFGTSVLYWSTANDLFGISDEQVPPELKRQETVVTTGTRTRKKVIGEEGDD